MKWTVTGICNFEDGTSEAEAKEQVEARFGDLLDGNAYLIEGEHLPEGVAQVEPA